MKKYTKNTENNPSGRASSNKAKKAGRRTEKWLQEAISQVLTAGANSLPPIEASLQKLISYKLTIEIDEFRPNSVFLIQDIREFADWLSSRKLNELKEAQQLEYLFTKYPLAERTKWLQEFFQLIFTDSRLLSLYYIYSNIIEKDGGFLDKLIWNKYLPYPDAKVYYGEELIEDELNDLGSWIPTKGFGKWASFLMENYHDDNPYSSEVPDETSNFDLFGRFRRSIFLNDHVGAFDDDFDDDDDYYDDDDDDYDHDDDDDEDEDEDEDEDDGNIRRENLIYELPEFMQIALRQVAAKPENYAIHPVEIPEHYKVYEAEMAVYQDLPKILVYLQQGKIKYTQLGAFSLSSVRIASKKLALHNFNNDTGYIKILLMGTQLWSDQYNPTTPVIDILRHVFKVQQPTVLCLIAALFPYENIRSFPTYALRPEALSKTFDLLSLLPEGQWVNRDQLLQYLELHEKEFTLHPINQYGSLWDLRLSRSNPFNVSFWEADSPGKIKYIQDLLITGTFLTAAAFGLLDLAYDTTDSYDFLAGGFSETYPWISFTSCRLTPLGAHFFKDKIDYVPPASVADALRFELAPTQLQIKVQGNMEIASEMLKAWTKVSNLHADLLELDEARIIARCRNKADLIQQIREFKESIVQPLPDYWQARLMQLIRRADSIQKVVATVVYKLSPHDLVLQRLIAQDPILKKYCLKAEQFMLIVSKSHEEAFASRLAELGYVPSDNGQGRPEVIEFARTAPSQLELTEQFKSLMEQKPRKATPKTRKK